jgi:hypothetical protein
MKFRIFFITVGAPLLLATGILWPPMDRLSVRLALIIAITTGLLISLFFNRKKYLRSLVAGSGSIRMECISAPLVTRYRNISFDDLQDVRLSPDGFRYESAGILHLKTAGKWESYIILDKKLFQQVQQSLAQAGLQVGKGRAVPVA